MIGKIKITGSRARTGDFTIMCHEKLHDKTHKETKGKKQTDIIMYFNV